MIIKIKKKGAVLKKVRKSPSKAGKSKPDARSIKSTHKEKKAQPPASSILNDPNPDPDSLPNPYIDPSKVRKGRTIPDILKRLGNEYVGMVDPIKQERLVLARKEHMLRGVYYEAVMNREPWAINFISERTEGKVKETVQQIIEHLVIDVEAEVGETASPDDDIYNDDGELI